MELARLYTKEEKKIFITTLLTLAEWVQLQGCQSE